MSIGKIISKLLSEGSELPKGRILSQSAQSQEITKFKHSMGTTNPLAPLSRDTVELNAVSAFEKSLNAHYKQSPLEVTIGTKNEIWQRYADSQMGSQDAFWAKNAATGELYYIKFAQDAEKEGHIASEILASKLYKLAGIETPEVTPITIEGGKKALASKYIPDMTNIAPTSTVRQGFAVDAWLANWDSLINENTFVKNGKLIKVDNGGALRYRAQGRLKPNFGDKVEELVTLVDGRNPVSSYVYSSMTNKELVDSFMKVCTIPDKAIKATVEDKELAQILINRKNYMKEILTEMQETPRTDEDLAAYFSKLSANIAGKKLFKPDSIINNLSMVINSRIVPTYQDFAMPSTKTVASDLVFELKQLEKRGVKISQEDVENLLQKLITDGVNLDFSLIKNNVNAGCKMEEQYNRMFTNFLNLMPKNPPKDGEKMSSYLSRISKIRERRIKQMDDFRIKSIKSKLKNEPEPVRPKNNVLTPTERENAIAELEAARKSDLALGIHTIPKLRDNATDKEIHHAWQRGHMGAFEFSDESLQKAVMGVGGRYNSKQPIKTKTIYEAIAEKDYKQEFELEPVYHWFNVENPESFVKKLPKTGEIYTIDQRQCCSTHKTYAEVDYGDHVPYLNIKYIIHPKSETSRAYNLGYNQEVIYPAGESFRILDKECVEYIDPRNGSGTMRWEVHMQEV